MDVMSVIGLIADAHGNAPAFERGISLLKHSGAEQIYFLGDAIGYIPSVAVIDALNALGNYVHCIRGNHEVMLLDEQISPERDAVYLISRVRQKLRTEHLRLIKKWPESRNEVIDSLKVLFVHGSPSDPTHGYVYPNTELSSFQPNAKWVFMAHTHYPFIRTHDGVHYVNVGSCGLPRDDGQYGSVAIFDTSVPNIHVLRYPIHDVTTRVIAQFPEIHLSVRDLLERRLTNIFGEICEFEY
jgi:putative phosphoesterase